MDIEYLTVSHFPTSELIRIFSQITIHDDMWFNGTPCWIWSGDRIIKTGYGRLSFKAKATRIHRLMFAWLVHPIPKGQKYGELDHLCRIVACCNPIHLDFTSGKINLLRGNGPPARNARKTHCKRGHPLSGDNLYFNRADGTERECRICYRARGRAYRERQKRLCHATAHEHLHAVIDSRNT